MAEWCLLTSKRIENGSDEVEGGRCIGGSGGNLYFSVME